jgi:multiple sugar transport system ATP-binding protein
VPKPEQEATLARVAALLQIEALLKRKPGQLSGGQRQRVAMGRALVRDPKLFLFDEPLSNLDAKLRVDMRTEIKKLHHRVGKTTVYVTHDQVEAMTLASRIAVMHQGSVQQFDEPQRIYDHPANMFVAGFMGSPAMNFIPAELTSEDGKPALSIKVAGGKTATLALFDDVASRATGKQVILGIRPEHLSRYDPEARAQKPGMVKLPAPVELVEPTGAETIAVMRLGDLEIVGRFDPDEAPHMGEDILLGVDMAHACLFDPVTKQLI